VIIRLGPVVKDYIRSTKLLAQVSTTLVQGNSVVIPQEKLPPAPDGKVWQIAFFDEFNGTSIDSTKWNVLGDYIRGTNPGGYINKSDTYLDGQGHLVSRVRYDSDIGRYTGGNMDSMGKFSTTFGYINARINNHKTQGQSEAFWIMSGAQTNVDNSAQDGAEIDIYEKPDVGDNISRGTIWDGYLSGLKKDAGFVDIPGVSVGYHDFGLLWLTSEYRFFVDGKQHFYSTGGGVTQQPGYLIMGHGPSSWMGDITKATLPDYMYVDYVHAYSANKKTSFVYQIIQTKPNNTYADSGAELSDGILASSTDFKSSEWVGVVGQPTYYFDIKIDLPSDINQMIIHTMRYAGPGIYLPPKIQLLCGGHVAREWLISKPSEDGMYQIILSNFPSGCAQNNFTMRFWNGWWTFLSEITVKTGSDITPPTLQILSPANNSTTNPSSYAVISGNSVPISVSAQDNVAISKVQFKMGSTTIGVENSSPYNITFDSTKFTDGYGTITATAYDTSGNSTSYFVTVNISNKNILANNSSCESISVPSSVRAGSLFNASVTFINTGSATWIDNNQGTQDYYAATTPDGSSWFITYNTLNQFAHHWSQLQTTKVLPAGNATFNYTNITAPTTPGTYQLKFQMLQQNKGWFGSVCSKSITVI
jgi:beta-glucanase (GH16 family)